MADLLKNADAALYRAKRDGRGTFRVFEAEMDFQVQAKSRLAHDLRKAPVQANFILYISRLSMPEQVLLQDVKPLFGGGIPSADLFRRSILSL